MCTHFTGSSKATPRRLFISGSKIEVLCLRPRAPPIQQLSFVIFGETARQHTTPVQVYDRPKQSVRLSISTRGHTTHTRLPSPSRCCTTGSCIGAYRAVVAFWSFRTCCLSLTLLMGLCSVRLSSAGNSFFFLTIERMNLINSPSDW